jgi:hypothetical protein
MERTSSNYSKKDYMNYYSETRKDRTTGQNYSYMLWSLYGHNDMHHINYKQRICPNTLLQSELSFNCIYFAFEGDLMASRGGCNSGVYYREIKNER